jgi:hypothetical protein
MLMTPIKYIFILPSLEAWFLEVLHWPQILGRLSRLAYRQGLSEILVMTVPASGIHLLESVATDSCSCPSQGKVHNQQWWFQVKAQR